MKIGRMGYAVMMIILVEVALYLVGGTTYSDTSILSWILNPSTAPGTFYNVIYIAIGTVAVAIVASAFIQLNISAIYALISLVTITFAAVIFHLINFINGELHALDPTVALLVNVIIAGPMLIYYVFTVIEWVRENN